MAEAEDRPDGWLLDRHREGDADAFAELVRRHRDRLWAVALRTLGDPEEAADAVQDALLSAYRAAADFRGDAAVTTWLHRIVVNACLDRARRRQVRRTVPLPEQDADTDRARLDLAVSPDPTGDVDTSLDVAAALATLPLEQRAALVLVDLQGFPVDEAARILDVPPGTVKSRCARGRARLLPLLAHLRNDSRNDSRNDTGAARVQAPVSPTVSPAVPPAVSPGMRPGVSAEGGDRTG